MSAMCRCTIIQCSGHRCDRFLDKSGRRSGRDGVRSLAQSIISPGQAGKLAVVSGGAGRELDSTGEDQIGERTASALLNARVPESGVQIEGDVPFRVVSRQYGDTFSSMLVQRGGTRYAFLAVSAKYDGKTARDISVGAARAQLEQAYCGPGAGTCGTELRTVSGTYLHFKKAQTIFLLGSDDRVSRWFLYAKK